MCAELRAAGVRVSRLTTAGIRFLRCVMRGARTRSSSYRPTVHCRASACNASRSAAAISRYRSGQSRSRIARSPIVPVFSTRRLGGGFDVHLLPAIWPDDSPAIDGIDQCFIKLLRQSKAFSAAILNNGLSSRRRFLKIGQVDEVSHAASEDVNSDVREDDHPTAEICITGLGAAASLGLDIESIWTRVRAGECGIGAIPALESPLPPGSDGGQCARSAGRFLSDVATRGTLSAMDDRSRPARCATLLRGRSQSRCDHPRHNVAWHAIRRAFLRTGDYQHLTSFLAGDTVRLCAQVSRSEVSASRHVQRVLPAWAQSRSRRLCCGRAKPMSSLPAAMTRSANTLTPASARCA